MQAIDLSERPQSRADLPQWYAAALMDQQRSGLSIRAYAKRLGVTPLTLYQWKRRLRDEPVAASSSEATGLVELVLAESRVVTDGAKARAGFIIHLGKSRRLEIPDDFNDATLERLIAVLETC